MLRSLRLAIYGIGALGVCLIAGLAEASIPGPPAWGPSYDLVFSQDYTAMTDLSQLGVSSSMTLGTGDVWIAHTPTYTDWFAFISPDGNDDPFGVGNGYLDIRCQQNGSSTNGFDGYTSGLLSSVDQNGAGFAQEYGYFECSMWTPGGANTWPAFWLLDQPHVADPSDNPYATEIDITESYGNWGTGPNQSPAGQPDWDSTTWHWWNNSNDPGVGSYVQEPGMTTGYHQYGCDIEPTGLTFYFDRSAVWSVPLASLPSSTMLAKPMYLLLNLALGGGNYNNATGTGYNWDLTPNPSDLKVQYVAVWASPNSPNYVSPLPSTPTGLAATAGNKQVSLSWSASTGASSYNVYRGTSPGGEGSTAIASAGTSTTWTDNTVANGTSYYYKVAAVNSDGTSAMSNEASATPEAPVLHTFAQGLQLFSVPYDYPNDALFVVLGYSNPSLAVWTPSNSTYEVSPVTPADVLRLGQGYWARFPQAVKLEAAGNSASTSGPFSIPLVKGWNMVGDPFLSPVDMSALTVQDGTGAQETFAQANQSGLVGATIYSYPANSTNYTSQTSGTIEPYLGYWILAGKNCTLLVPPPPV